MVASLALSAVLLLAAADPAADPARDAQTYKKLGDELAAKDEVRKAADAYQQALDLGRAEFTPAECVRMAVVLSWDDRLKAAIHELNLVLDRDPTNLIARVELARVYSWDGQNGRAVDEADNVLMIAPHDAETLLVKANALQWDDRFDDAIPIYRQIIEEDGDFFARAGLATALLYRGNRGEAEQMAKRLTASNDREKRQLQRLSDAIAREMRPRMQLGFEYYSDSDKNQYDRYSARYAVGVGDHDFDLNIGTTALKDGSQATDASFGANFNVAGPLGLAAVVGVVRLRSAVDMAQFPMGRVQLHGRFHRTSVAGTASSEILTETPALVANHVRRLSAGLDLTQRLTARWSIGGAYTRLQFSDTNAANDANARAEFAVTLIPRITLGYQVRFADYARQSGSGFFDPSNFVSHRASASLNMENHRFITFVQIFGGHQKFVRNAFETGEWAKGGRISLGLKATTRFTIEVNASAGDFATGSVSGFRYFMAGSRVSYRF